MESISFCILKQSPFEEAIDGCITNIIKQNVPDFEILVFDLFNNTSNYDYGNVKINYLKSNDRFNLKNTNKIKNILCERSSREYIVLMYDNLRLTPDWYAYIRGVDFYDVFGCRLTTLEGKRVLDWAYKLNENVYHPLLYDEWTNKAFITGLIVIKKEVWEKVKFSDGVSSGLEGDIDFCRRASEIGFRVGVWPNAIAVYHNKEDKEFANIIVDDPQRVKRWKNSFILHDFITQIKRFLKEIYNDKLVKYFKGGR